MVINGKSRYFKQLLLSNNIIWDLNVVKKDAAINIPLRIFIADIMI